MESTGLLVSLQLNYNTKFQQRLDLFDAVETDGQFEILGKPGLDNTALQFLPMLLQMLVWISYIHGREM